MNRSLTRLKVKLIIFFKSWRARALNKKIVKTEIFQIYTDGSHKERWGSWAYVILKDERVVAERSGRVSKTGSTRMEFQAVIEALKSLPPGSQAHVFSDSRILIEAMTSKMRIWQQQGWVNKSGHPIPNGDLIKLLNELTQVRKVSWQWIKAHSGIKYNERCDALCTQARLGPTLSGYS